MYRSTASGVELDGEETDGAEATLSTLESNLVTPLCMRGRREDDCKKLGNPWDATQQGLPSGKTSTYASSLFGMMSMWSATLSMSRSLSSPNVRQGAAFATILGRERRPVLEEAIPDDFLVLLVQGVPDL